MDFEPPKQRSKYLKDSRPQKDSFQRELDSVLKKRNSLYSSNDFSDDDGLGMDDGKLMISIYMYLISFPVIIFKCFDK